MNHSAVPRRVVLLIEASSDFTSRLIRGIAAYSQSNGPWLIKLFEENQNDLRSLTRTLSASDGIIVRTESKKLHERILSLRIPSVNVGGTSFSDQVPWVSVNNEAITRLVFQEFRNNQHTQFAFFGPERRTWACDRETGFQRIVTESKQSFHGSFAIKIDAPQKAAEHEQLTSWLQNLPKPIAIMAANDVCGHRLLVACHDAGIKVPEHVAVVGVNNDELICELSLPSLTSVSTNTERIGHKAAELLDLQMSNQPLSEFKVKVEPLAVEARRSTDHMAGADPFVGLAFRFIQRHACDGINVEDVLKVVPMSRTSLESAFRQLVGRSPHHEISRVRVERARRLLLESHLRVAEIARRCGYSTVEYFSAAFKREVGISPTDFRRQLRRDNE